MTIHEELVIVFLHPPYTCEKQGKSNLRITEVSRCLIDTKHNLIRIIVGLRFETSTESYYANTEAIKETLLLKKRMKCRLDAVLEFIEICSGIISSTTFTLLHNSF
ncbi:CLUMA_CG004633, isoform A [Clunio marinus]|uniref:CLUMA_CG004633, isoform A n=1 Tax=Clunio marinus TaxID=568069 RepID=A0A1J1HS84_9DIPT|nr:CLUMA_CG004633, isoform A [Clunio marinus]